MTILSTPISINELEQMSQNIFGDMIKCVADIRTKKLSLDGELHSDLESLMLDDGSEQEDLWGFNLYPNLSGKDFIEFDSLILFSQTQSGQSVYSLNNVVAMITALFCIKVDYLSLTFRKTCTIIQDLAVDDGG